jgi:hypothetical protein
MLIPTINNTFILSKEQIWQNSVKEIYEYCRQQNLPHVWMYIWEEWYTWANWILWARSISDEINCLRTTMTIESHWHVIKHDFLHHFNHPRLDLLIYILIQKVIPRQIDRLYLLSNNREITKWRKEFKHEWKRLQQKEVIYPNSYLTDVDKWICSCKYFLINRFMICKHLIHLKGPVYTNYFKKVFNII